jgi:hypothetical protein
MSAPEKPLRIVAVHFVVSAPFHDEITSARMGPNGNCVSAVPGVVGSDGGPPLPVSGNQRSDGMIVTRRDSAILVPWTNIRGVAYGR